MKFVLFALAAAIIAILILTQPKSAAPVASPSANEVPESAGAAPPPTPAPLPPQTREQLILVRGVVVGAVGNDLLVDCTPAGAGARDAARSANIAISEERMKYGATMILQNGAMRMAGWQPSLRPHGKAVLRDFPGAAGVANGAWINVIAAALPGNYNGMHILTAQFTVAGNATGSNPSWMNTHSDLDPKPRH